MSKKCIKYYYAFFEKRQKDYWIYIPAYNLRKHLFGIKHLSIAIEAGKIWFHSCSTNLIEYPYEKPLDKYLKNGFPIEAIVKYKLKIKTKKIL